MELNYPFSTGRSGLLGTEAFRNLLAASLKNAKKSVIILSAYVKEVGVKWMKEQIAANEAIEVPVINSYLGQYGGFYEKQYRHVASGKLWRLVWPDSPFTGIFEPVE